MAHLTREARLTYIALWCCADDYGVGEWCPLTIAKLAFPYDDDVAGDDVTKWVTEIASIKRVTFFECGDERFYHIPRFTKWQGEPSQNRQHPKPPAKKKVATPSAQVDPRVTSALTIWNEHKHPSQPPVRHSVNPKSARHRYLTEFLELCEWDLGVWTRCVQAFAKSSMHNGENREERVWGIDTMLWYERREKWLDAGQAVISPKAPVEIAYTEGPSLAARHTVVASRGRLLHSVANGTLE